MARVEWIRLDVDIFQNPKLKRIRREEYGTDKILVWIMMLTTAGRCNEGGMLKMGDGMPYEIEDLVDEYHLPQEVVAEAIKSFMRYGLVEQTDGCYCLPGWEEHQNSEGLERIREGNRERKRAERERKKMSQNMSCDSHVTKRDSHATEEEREEELEKEKEYINPSYTYYPILEASKHYQALNQPKTIRVTGITAEMLEEAEKELAMEESLKELKEFT